MSRWAYFSFCAYLVLNIGCISTKPSSQGFATALDFLQQSELDEQSSREMLKLASDRRLELKKLHRLKPSADRRHDVDKISSTKASMIELRRLGARKRTTAKTNKAKAQRAFAVAMVDRWPQWIKNTSPLTLDTTSPIVERGHNTRVASVRTNPRLIDNVRRDNQYKELLASIPDEQMAPKDLNLESFQISRSQTMVGHIETENASGVPLNKIHSWRFVVSDTKGYPVNRSFKVVGHMPGHVHGLPTQPRITRKLDEGVYLIEGLKFQMRGWWVMELVSPKDRIRFNIVL